MKDTPFASVSSSRKKAERDRAARRFSDLRASLTRLVANDDFRAWFRFIDWELCGESFGTGALDEFTQGKRATIGFMKDSLAIADGGPDFLADLARKHYTAVSDARIEAQRANNENGEHE